MIIDALLKFVSFLVNVLFGWLPQVEAIPQWYQPFRDYFLDALIFFATVPILGPIVIMGTTIAALFAGWQLVYYSNWLYNKIRGSG